MRRVTTYWCGFAAVLLLDHPVDASESLTSDQLTALIAKVDTSKDGKASFEEIMRFAHATEQARLHKERLSNFEKADKDGDSKLTLPELLQHLESRDAMSFQREVREKQRKHASGVFSHALSATNQDGSLDKVRTPLTLFRHIFEGFHRIVVDADMRRKDADGDGKLTIREYYSITDAVPSKTELVEFAEADRNKDGFLTAREVLQPPAFAAEFKPLFKLADKDNDGHVSAAELHQSQKDIEETKAFKFLVGWVEHHEL
mmetsp:Transcript_63627/g.120457  ORF Transcript_63627/g.120457 Transcript_63627/m.120457 type:complete len:259 (-) Transcript_63627:29-805(-)